MNWLRRIDPRRGLTPRLVLVNLTVIVVALGALVLWTGNRLQAGIVEEAEHELEVQALIVANGMLEPLSTQLAYEQEVKARDESEHEDEEGDEHKSDRDDESSESEYSPIGDRDFKAVVDAYAAQADARVTVLDPRLQVLYSSDATVPAHVEDRHPEILAALRGQEQHDVRHDEWTNEERLFVATRVGTDESARGLVQLSIPISAVQTQVRSMWLLLIGAGLILALLSVAVSILFSRQITRPVHALTVAANQLAAGDLGTRLDLDRRDELGVLAASFDHMAEQISRLLARERTFIANASHELRSPLTAIQLRAELLQNASPGDQERMQRYLAEIGEESIRLSHLLEQLLDLNRIQSGPPTTNAPAVPSACLTRAADIMSPLADHAHIALLIDIPPQLPAIALDAGDCELLVRNLLDNAIKYTPPGGQVRLSASASQSHVEIVVQDSGVGIPAADLPLIFNRFYRVDKARNGNGSGLGLALVKEIVEQCGGEISVTSAEGVGTKFVVVFPITATD